MPKDKSNVNTFGTDKIVPVLNDMEEELVRIRSEQIKSILGSVETISTPVESEDEEVELPPIHTLPDDDTCVYNNTLDDL